MARLRKAGVTLLNQSVLLRGVNDSARVLAT
jgi:L-lysine 2,3-aminomutase